MMSYDVQDTLALRRVGYKPYARGRVDGCPVECISFPYPSDDGRQLLIQVRTPEDPTTMRTVSCGEVYIACWPVSVDEGRPLGVDLDIDDRDADDWDFDEDDYEDDDDDLDEDDLDDFIDDDEEDDSDDWE